MSDSEPNDSYKDVFALIAGKSLDAASFFSGLIDDVRIHNKALSAEDITALSE